MPPPRRDDKKFVVIVAACAAAILALAVGAFIVWQDAEQKRHEVEKQNEKRLSEERELADRKAKQDIALSNFVVAVNERVRELENLKGKIPVTENLEQSESGIGKVREIISKAREDAVSQGVEEGKLKPEDEKFENAIAEVMEVIKGQREQREAACKIAKEAAEAEKRKAESRENVTKSKVADKKPDVPINTRPAFFEAETVEMTDESDLNKSDFIKKCEKMKVFYYANGDRKDFVSEEVLMRKIGTFCSWSPSPRDVNDKSKGHFSIWFSEKDKTAYWLWNLPHNADNGSCWFKRAENEPDSVFVKVNLKQEVFGSSEDVFDFYTKHFGDPTFTVACTVQANNVSSEVSTNEMSITVKLFEPTDDAKVNQRESLKKAVSAAEKKLEAAKKAFKDRKNKVTRVKDDIGKLKDSVKNIAELKKQKKEVDGNKKYDDGAKKNMKAEFDDKIKKADDNKGKLIKGIVKDLKDLNLGLIIEESPFNGNKVTDIDSGFEKYKKKLEQIEQSKEEDDKGCIGAKENLTKKETLLKEFDANFEKTWRGVAEKSRYAVKAVRGSKESEKARK